MKLFEITAPCMKYVSAQAKKLGLANIGKVELTDESVKISTNDGKNYKLVLVEEKEGSDA